MNRVGLSERETWRPASIRDRRLFETRRLIEVLRYNVMSLSVYELMGVLWLYMHITNIFTLQQLHVHRRTATFCVAETAACAGLTRRQRTLLAVHRCGLQGRRTHTHTHTHTQTPVIIRRCSNTINRAGTAAASGRNL